MADTEAPVLIAGGSLAGLTTAAFLGQHGIRALVVERHRGTAIHPRAALVYQRSMEILRSIGIEQAVRHRSYEQFEPDGAIMSVETLAGRELNWDVAQLNQAVRNLSPTERLFVTQDALEPMLNRRAEELGAEVRFGAELTSWEQDGEGIRAVIRERDTDQSFTVRAEYLIAADGGRSEIRERLGIPLVGHGLLSRSVTIYFRADVGPLLRGRNLSVILVRNPTFRGFFRIEKPYQSGFLIVHMLGDPDEPITDVWDLTEERCVELIHAGLGNDDLPITVEDVQRWECRADVAASFRQDRVFLVGDAAHVMPPYGGFGGNVAIQDAHNIAWKLGMVLNGRAGAGLLATYEPERRPVSELTVEQAYMRYVLRAALYLQGELTQPFVKDDNIDLGYRYHSAAVMSEGDGEVHEDPRECRGRPGTRAPHIVLTHAEKQISTHDLLGRGFVLFVGPDGSGWREGARRAARQLHLDLDVHMIDGPSDLRDPSGGFLAGYGITGAGAVLVRPDGFVAWRATGAADTPAEAIAGVLSSILRREPGRDTARASLQPDRFGAMTGADLSSRPSAYHTGGK
jgi:2-polyprenyl-6-methoxyphenol hydroxylase-like FAD-dependent oxidoreductase